MSRPPRPLNYGGQVVHPGNEPASLPAEQEAEAPRLHRDRRGQHEDDLQQRAR
jgi:hypothetical protein